MIVEVSLTELGGMPVGCRRGKMVIGVRMNMNVRAEMRKYGLEL